MQTALEARREKVVDRFTKVRAWGTTATQGEEFRAMKGKSQEARPDPMPAFERITPMGPLRQLSESWHLRAVKGRSQEARLDPIPPRRDGEESGSN